MPDLKPGTGPRFGRKGRPRGRPAPRYLSLPQVIGDLREALKLLRRVLEIQHPAELNRHALGQAIAIIKTDLDATELQWQAAMKRKYDPMD